MDPQSDMSQGLHLPQPSISKGSSLDYQEMATPTAPISPVATGFSAHPTGTTPIHQNFTSLSNGVSQPQTANAGDQADDLDKEWITKAKMIVEQTKNDPYTQSKEIARVKADYLRIRYNKHIKVGPDKAL